MTTKIEVSEEQAKERHPLEWVAEPMRIQENPYARMTEKSLMITNFPKSVTVTKRFLRDLILKYDSSAVVNHIQLVEANLGQNFEERNQIAYAIVDFEMDKWVASVKRGLRKHWEQDKLLKVKTLKDEAAESHSKRTIALEGLPSHTRVEDIASAFSQFGAITSIEAPTIDAYIQSQMEQKGLLKDVYSKERQLKKEQEFRYAQIVLNDTLDFDSQFETLLAESWGEQEANEMINMQKDAGAGFTKVDLLDEEKFNTFMRVMAQLQAEGIQVETAKSTLGSLAKEIDGFQEGVPELKKSLDGLVLEKKQSIESTLKYLMNNQDSLKNSQRAFLSNFKDGLQGQIDPIHKLQRMSLDELTNAYDLLLGILNQREELVKERLKESLKHFGREEKILFESHDPKRELETMPDILRKIYNHDPSEIDRILGLNEQIQTVNMNKNLPPQEKLYQWMTNTADFSAQKNWNENQLAYAETYDHDMEREVLIPRKDLSKSEIREQGGAPSPFHDKYLKRIQAEVEKYRNEMDTPFDEIYHKERKLVQDIVRAMQSIKDIQSKLPNPAANRMFDPKDIEEDPEYGDIYNSQGETQFIKDKKLEQRMNNANLLSFKDSLGDSKHAYSQIEKQTIDDLIKSGQIDRSEYEAAKANKLANNQVSMGYAFVTFSHADEAKKTLLQLENEVFLDSSLISLRLKGRLDHSELDRSYFLKKMKNEGKLVEQRAELRDAKKRLRDFESNIDKELPSLKRLKDFKAIAQELIENPKGKTRRHASGRRTKRETEELYQKLKEYQRENPNIDVTSLFESDKLDHIRREQHKRSFQNFKKFEFLKAGVEDPRAKKEKSKPDLFEPFNYPPLKESVGMVLADGINGRINYSGLPINNPGRRFDYSEQEFLEAYLGKDFARKIDLNENDDNHIFGFQDSLKKMFPDKNKYLKMPHLLEDQKRLEDFYGLRYEDGKAKDNAFAEFLRDEDNDISEKLLQSVDAPHSEDPSRSKIKDIRQQLALLEERVKKSGSENVKMRDALKIFDQIQQEYENPLELDSHGQVHEEFAQKLQAKFEGFEEEMIPQIEELEKEVMVDSEEESEEYKRGIIELLSKYDTADFKIAEYLPDEISGSEDGDDDFDHTTEAEGEGNAEAEAESGGEEDEEEFEGKSMFNPDKDPEFMTTYKTIKDERIKFYEELDDENNLSIGKTRFGSKDKYKRSNENLYNIQHATKKNRLNEGHINAKKLKTMAKAVTQYKRDQFERVKSEQHALPAEERVPHYIDSNGMVQQYSPEQIAKDKNLENVLNLRAEDAIKDMTIADYLTTFKKFAPVKETLVTHGNEINTYAKTYMDEKDLAEHNFRKSEHSKSLESFSQGKEDIYDSYRALQQKEESKSSYQKIRAKLQAQKAKYKALKEVHDEAQSQSIEAPSFDQYLKSEAKGSHALNPFSETSREVDEELERIQEAEEDEQTYRKELMARLFGGKLTSRQFGVLLKMPQDQQDQEMIARKSEFRIRREMEDDIRNGEELVESFRRQMVIKGECSEAESYSVMQAKLDEIKAKYPTKSALDIYRRESVKEYQKILDLRNSQQLLNREYYFDEGLGQSLNEHTADLKKNFPGITVQTRRDRDGLPIVRVQIKPKYKYNLDEILAVDPTEMKKLQNETHEALLEEFMPENPKDFMKKVGEYQNVRAQNGDSLTVGQTEKLKALFTQRFHGIYKEDLAGFKKQLKAIKQDNKGPLAHGPYAGNDFTPEGRAMNNNSAFDELLRDQKLFEFEIQTQMSLKLKDKRNFTKLEQSDFMTFSSSEHTVFRDQVSTLQDSMEILEKDNEWLLKTGASLEKGASIDGEFDKEAYSRLKKEIQRKREAKERVLQQGFPEFKPYMRL